MTIAANFRLKVIKNQTMNYDTFILADWCPIRFKAEAVAIFSSIASPEIETGYDV